ncbi:MAG: hypothetical protein WC107_04020 [Patescibacteria group bacterium]
MRKSLAIFSLTSCEGCQFEMLNSYEEFSKLLDYFDIKNFRLGSNKKEEGPYDVAIVEGSPGSKEQIEHLKKIRKESGIIIALGACAHLGGIQSERNGKEFTKTDKVKTVPEVIKVDFIIPGCPIRHEELYKCLLDIYWGKEFTLPDLAVCFECRQNENECRLKNRKACLGPITRMGCNSVCVNNGEACLGCRGPIPQPNVKKLKQILDTMVEREETENLFTIYGNLDK